VWPPQYSSRALPAADWASAPALSCLGSVPDVASAWSRSGVRLLEEVDPTKRGFYINPALYAVAAGGAAGFLLLTSALQRGSVTTAVAGMVVGETIGPALVGVVWLGDRTREGLGWMVVAGFAIAVAGTLVLARFGKAPAPNHGPRQQSDLDPPSRHELTTVLATMTTVGLPDASTYTTRELVSCLVTPSPVPTDQRVDWQQGGSRQISTTGHSSHLRQHQAGADVAGG
jgi:hypothetical protein